MLITAAHSRCLPVVDLRGVGRVEAQRRFRRWFRLLLRRRRRKVVLVRGLVVGMGIVRGRIAGMIMIVGILIRASTMYVRRALDDLLDVTYGVSVGSVVFDVIWDVLSLLPATTNHLVAQHSVTEDVIVFLSHRARF